ncbi:hypothetical protein F5884DRAFT_855596 [Xylogone sp. PMI_703]|nr:hypothetical protein F5884DRAFT_855596 [Xylogone sp. PMI_703]
MLQYDFGKVGQNGEITPTGTLNKPPQQALIAISALEAKYMIQDTNYKEIVDRILTKHANMRRKFMYPGTENDILYYANYDHKKGDNCSSCDRMMTQTRQERETNEPVIHYGLIGSGNQVIKDGRTREQLRQKHDILCFEMEAAGMMDTLDCLVIRGICDYADSHKNKRWQGYASIVAAAYAKDLILSIRNIGSTTPQTPTENKQWQEYASTAAVYAKGRLASSGADDTLSLGARGSVVPPTDSGYASIPHYKPADDAKITQEEDHGDFAEEVQSMHSNEEVLVSETSSSPKPTFDLMDGRDEDDDVNSIYTEGPNMSPSKRESYISELADDLFNKVQLEKSDEQIPERMYRILPRLLKAFALKIGHFGSTQMHRDVMVFIRRHRDDIASGLRMKYLEEDEIRPQVAGYDADDMRLDDLMNLWYGHLEDMEDDIGGSQVDWDGGSENSSINDDIDMEESDRGLPELEVYRKFISNIPAYEWLLESIHTELLLAPAEPSIQNAIRKKILNSLPSSSTVSRYDHPNIYQARFILEWDLMAFLREEEYDQGTDGLLGKIITITGLSKDAQAMTCLQYLHQTWQSYGSHLLQLIEATLFSEAGCAYRCTLPDKTKLAAWVQESNFIVEVIGISDSVAEIGEQLAVMSVENCPHVTRESPVAHISCNIDFKFDDEGQQSPDSSIGQCWHHLFRNPVIVGGYPIPRRSKHGTGLEIPLNIMAGLAQAQHIDAFNNKLFIKGFSTMLIPTEHHEDLIIWHLLYNVDGNRISYLDSNVAHAENVTISDLERSRHVLGWCSEARCYAGAIDATYSINRSWLRRPSSDCRLRNTSVSAGKLIVGGDIAVHGNKDLPYRILREDYIEKLSWISKRYVVLWDVRDKRGWLVNGVSALLHLLYASLEFSKTDELKFAFRFNLGEMIDAETPHTASSAMEVLLNPENLVLELYHGKGTTEAILKPSSSSEIPKTGKTHIRLRDRIERLYNMLEKIIDHQEEIMGIIGEELKHIGRKNLEGWDFKDLATNEDPLHPRVCKLGTRGKCWVDFSRAIRAVTLFGTGFGEIIQPAHVSGPCKYWATLPKGKSYLAISVSDLDNIIDRFGNPNSSPVRLTSHLVWYNPNDSLQACQCIIEQQQTEHSELAQVVLPSHFRKRLPKHNSVRLKDWGSGAIVFGYNADLGWFWNDTGYLEQGEAPQSSDDSGSESDDEFHDTGIGTSLAPLISVDEKETPEPPMSGPLPGSLTHEHYEIGIVCALWKELLAVRALFDFTHSELKTAEEDPNRYCLGRIKDYNVVAAGLPSNDYGTNSATNVASHLIRSFPAVKFCLVVGIGGGVPSIRNDIRLGDIVVGTHVIQYDMGKHIQNSTFKMTGNMQRPPTFLSSAINVIASDPILSFSSASNPLLEDINRIITMRPEYRFPGVDEDKLFKADYLHEKDEPTCENCTGAQRKRKDRPHNGPRVIYGLIASGNQVVRDAILRDRLWKENNVLCFEMEAAGVMKTTRCLVIRGICDYSDSHKSNLWQEYASATAAAYAKFFISHIPKWDDSVRVQSQLEVPVRPIHLQKQKRAVQSSDHGSSASKRFRWK